MKSYKSPRNYVDKAYINSWRILSSIKQNVQGKLFVRFTRHAEPCCIWTGVVWRKWCHQWPTDHRLRGFWFLFWICSCFLINPECFLLDNIKFFLPFQLDGYWYTQGTVSSRDLSSQLMGFENGGTTLWAYLW